MPAVLPERVTSKLFLDHRREVELNGLVQSGVAPMDEVATGNALPVPYGAIGLLFEQKAITLFLGAAASLASAGSNALPDGRKFSEDLAKLANYPINGGNDALTKVSQYLVEYAGDRDLILRYIKAQFHEKIPEDYSCAVTDFLGEI